MAGESDDHSGNPPPKEAGAYQVGYGRPPREHQFRKGAPSPNPKGRPKKSESDQPDLMELLLAPVTVMRKGRRTKMRFMDALVEKLKADAFSGDDKAIRTIFALAKTTKIFEIQEKRRKDSKRPILLPYFVDKDRKPVGVPPEIERHLLEAEEEARGRREALAHPVYNPIHETDT